MVDETINRQDPPRQSAPPPPPPPPSAPRETVVQAAQRHISRALDAYDAGGTVSLQLNTEEKSAIEAHIKSTSSYLNDAKRALVARLLNGETIHK